MNRQLGKVLGCKQDWIHKPVKLKAPLKRSNKITTLYNVSITLLKYIFLIMATELTE